MSVVLSWRGDYDEAVLHAENGEGDLGVLARHRFELSLFPESLSRIALVAPLVGAAEEVVFRGYMQGLIQPLGRGFSIVFAASAHQAVHSLQ